MKTLSQKAFGDQLNQPMQGGMDASLPGQQAGLEENYQRQQMLYDPMQPGTSTFAQGGMINDNLLASKYPKEYDVYKKEMAFAYGGRIPQHGFGEWLGRNASTIGTVVGGVGGFLVAGPAGAALGAKAGGAIGSKFQTDPETGEEVPVEAAGPEMTSLEAQSKFNLCECDREEAVGGAMAYGGRIPTFKMGGSCCKKCGGHKRQYAQGGDIDKAEFEVEGGEVVQSRGMMQHGPGGNINYLSEEGAKIEGPDHGPDSRDPNSGVKMSTSSSSDGRVFSKRLKNPDTGKNFAEESEKLLKKIGKYEETLNNNASEPIGRKTAQIMSDKYHTELDQLFTMQEQMKKEKGIDTEPATKQMALDQAIAQEQGMVAAPGEGPMAMAPAPPDQALPMSAFGGYLPDFKNRTYVDIQGNTNTVRGKMSQIHMNKVGKGFEGDDFDKKKSQLAYGGFIPQHGTGTVIPPDPDPDAPKYLKTPKSSDKNRINISGTPKTEPGIDPSINIDYVRKLSSGDLNLGFSTKKNDGSTFTFNKVIGKGDPNYKAYLGGSYKIQNQQRTDEAGNRLKNQLRLNAGISFPYGGMIPQHEGGVDLGGGGGPGGPIAAPSPTGGAGQPLNAQGLPYNAPNPITNPPPPGTIIVPDPQYPGLELSTPGGPGGSASEAGMTVGQIQDKRLERQESGHRQGGGYRPRINWGNMYIPKDEESDDLTKKEKRALRKGERKLKRHLKKEERQDRREERRADRENRRSENGRWSLPSFPSFGGGIPVGGISAPMFHSGGDIPKHNPNIHQKDIQEVKGLANKVLGSIEGEKETVFEKDAMGRMNPEIAKMVSENPGILDTVAYKKASKYLQDQLKEDPEFGNQIVKDFNIDVSKRSHGEPEKGGQGDMNFWALKKYLKEANITGTEAEALMKEAGVGYLKRKAARMMMPYGGMIPQHAAGMGYVPYQAQGGQGGGYQNPMVDMYAQADQHPSMHIPPTEELEQESTEVDTPTEEILTTEETVVEPGEDIKKKEVEKVYYDQEGLSEYSADMQEEFTDPETGKHYGQYNEAVTDTVQSFWSPYNKGVSGYPYGKEAAWSAVTVSNLVSDGLFGGKTKEEMNALGFRPSFRHSTYIGDAFKTNKNDDYKYNMYRATPFSYEDSNEATQHTSFDVGDILFRGRGSAQGEDFEKLSKRAGKRYESHTDIITGTGKDEFGSYYELSGGNRKNPSGGGHTYVTSKMYYDPESNELLGTKAKKDDDGNINFTKQSKKYRYAGGMKMNPKYKQSMERVELQELQPVVIDNPAEPRELVLPKVEKELTAKEKRMAKKQRKRDEAEEAHAKKLQNSNEMADDIRAEKSKMPWYRRDFNPGATLRRDFKLANGGFIPSFGPGGYTNPLIDFYQEKEDEDKNKPTSGNSGGGGGSSKEDKMAMAMKLAPMAMGAPPMQNGGPIPTFPYGGYQGSGYVNPMLGFYAEGDQHARFQKPEEDKKKKKKDSKYGFEDAAKHTESLNPEQYEMDPNQMQPAVTDNTSFGNEVIDINTSGSTWDWGSGTGGGGTGFGYAKGGKLYPSTVYAHGGKLAPSETEHLESGSAEANNDDVLGLSQMMKMGGFLPQHETGTDNLSSIRKQPGMSNAGKYPGVSKFAGPHGTYPINTLARGESALKLRGHSNNPDQIASNVYSEYPSLRPDHTSMAAFGGSIRQFDSGGMSNLSAVGAGVGAMSSIPTTIYDFVQGAKDPHEWESLPHGQKQQVLDALAKQGKSIEDMTANWDQDSEYARQIFKGLKDLDISQQRADVKSVSATQMDMLRGGAGSRAEMMANAQNFGGQQVANLNKLESQKAEYDQNVKLKQAAGVADLGKTDAAIAGQQAGMWGQQSAAYNQFGQQQRDYDQYLAELNKGEQDLRDMQTRSGYAGVGNFLSDAGSALMGTGMGMG